MSGSAEVRSSFRHRGRYIVGHYPTQFFLYIINPPKNVIPVVEKSLPRGTLQ